MGDEASGFSAEPGYVDDLARVLADMPPHGVDQTAGLEAEVAMLRSALAEADAEIHGLNSDLAALQAQVRGWLGDWRLVRGRRVNAMAVAELVAFARLDEAAQEWL